MIPKSMFNFQCTSTSWPTATVHRDVIMSLYCLPKHYQPPYTSVIYCGKDEQKTGKNRNVWLLHNYCRQIFPTAKCSSHEKEFSTSTDDYEEDGFRLPGVQVKKRIFSQAQKFGEFDVNHLIQAESGWDRVKFMYRTKSGIFQDESTQALNTMLYRTVIIGFFANAIVANLRHNTSAEKNLSKIEAMRKGVASEGLKSKTVLITALKDTAKLSVFTLSLLHLSQTIAAYRNKTSVWEYTFSSAIGFGTIGISKGLHKFTVLTIGGALFGSILGFAVCNVLRKTGFTQELRSMKRMQQRLQEQRMQNAVE